MGQPITKAIVPAAGLGTRLLPTTKSLPKEMLPVGRKPVVQHVVEELQGAGLRHILIITGRRKRAIEDHFDADPQLVAELERAGKEGLLPELDHLAGDAQLFYTRQGQPKGLGHAVALGASFVDGDDCVVALGDSVLAAEDTTRLLRGMMQAYQNLGAAAVVAVERVPEAETSRYGIVGLEGGEPPPEEPVRMTGVVEKPRLGTAPSTLAVAARYVFGPALFQALDRTLPDQRGEIQLSDAIERLIEWGKPVYAWLLAADQARYDVGNFDGYFRACVDFALADPQYGAQARATIQAKADGV